MPFDAKKYRREYIARKRAEAKARGEVLRTDTWFKRNPDKHADRTRRWRDENKEVAQDIYRKSQAKRRNTPRGKINNCLWAVMSDGLKANRPGTRSKYCAAIGYDWPTLKTHLTEQFTDGMSWDNWGELWEIDHIKPISSFDYESIDDPAFKEAWQLSNIRPLLKFENGSKGTREAPRQRDAA